MKYVFAPKQVYAVSKLVFGTTLAVALSSTASLAQEQKGLIKVEKDWRLSVGGGLMIGPEYVGSTDTSVTPLPLIDYRYQDWFFASTRDGIGVQYNINKHTAFGVRGNYDFGREEKSGTRLQGMGDIDGTPTVGAFAEFKAGYWKVKATIDADATGTGHEGYSGDFDLSWGTRFGPGATLTITGGISYMDDSYAQSFFGVTPTQSAASGNAVTTPGFGMKDIHGSVTTTYPLTERVMGIASLGYTNLNGDSQDSPITEEDSYFTTLIGASYSF